MVGHIKEEVSKRRNYSDDEAKAAAQKLSSGIRQNVFLKGAEKIYHSSKMLK